jgi:peptidoglycan/LPS O-acetylase OafA/YrhL
LPQGTEWLNAHSAALTLSAIGHESTLVFGAGDPWFTTVLWSLHWEILFSLLLPVFVLMARAQPLAVAVMALGVTAFGARSGWFAFMPTFLLGCCMAFERERIERLLRDPLAWSLALAAAICSLTADAWLRSPDVRSVTFPVCAAGACLFVGLALADNPVRAWLSTRPMQIVGKRSFSLYLVHEPLVVTAAFLLRGSSPLVLAVTAIPAIAVCCEVFYRLIERRSHGWARQAGAAASARVGARTRVHVGRST